MDCALSSSASVGLKQRWSQLEQSFRNLRPARRSSVGLARSPPTSLPAGQLAESATAARGPSCHAIALCDVAVAPTASQLELRVEKTHAVAATAAVHDGRAPSSSPLCGHLSDFDRGSWRLGRSSLCSDASPLRIRTARQCKEPGLSADYHASSPFDQTAASIFASANSDSVPESCRRGCIEEEARDVDQSPSQGALFRLTQRMRDLEAGIQTQRLRDLERGIRQALWGARGWREEIVFTEKDRSMPAESLPSFVNFLKGLVSENESLRERESKLFAELQTAKSEAGDAAERVDLQMQDLVEEIEHLRGEWADLRQCPKCAAKFRSNAEEAASYSSGQSTNYTEQIFDADDELASCSAEGSCDVERHRARTNFAMQRSTSGTESWWPQFPQPRGCKESVPPLKHPRVPFSSYVDDFEPKQKDAVGSFTNAARKHMLRPEVLSPKGLSCEAVHHSVLRDEASTSTNPALQKLLGMVSLTSFASPQIADTAPSVWRPMQSPRSFDRGSPHGTGLYATTRAARSDSPVERLARQSTRPNPLLLGLSRPSL